MEFVLIAAVDAAVLDRLRGSQVFLPAALPPGFEHGPVGHCFDVCAMIAMHNPQLRYVEGIARIPGESWALHAWLTDQNGIDAYDPTWLAIDNMSGAVRPAPARYIGVVMETRSVLGFMRSTGYQGVLANWSRNPSLAADCLGMAVSG